MSSNNGGVGVREIARSGQAGLGVDGLVEIQRGRILTAMIVEVAEHGVGNVTVAHVVARSGVSRRTFYELFADREECFLAAFDEGVERIASVVVPAYETSLKWVERVRAGLVSLLACLDEDPALARLMIVESLAAGSRALERRTRMLGTLTRLVDEGRGEATSTLRGAAVTAEGAVGAVLAVLHGRLVTNSREPLLGLAGPLVSMIVLPYLGPAAARRELERSVPDMKTRVLRRPVVNPLHELGMRLTYRTIRVLIAVADEPGSSNRIVSEGAGISDQGQVSKLLARLKRAGLVENAGAVIEHGMPNAWTLTEKGRMVHGAIAH
ncbi:MAG TPA: TetR family transcriptional regulator [Solirubrobacteraceae bacterium]|nr:TetR family transcriptional regulator [Solirubrobacteraceae bacterium]